LRALRSHPAGLLVLAAGAGAGSSALTHRCGTAHDFADLGAFDQAVHDRDQGTLVVVAELIDLAHELVQFVVVGFRAQLESSVGVTDVEI
jgi:hypothetical protein